MLGDEATPPGHGQGTKEPQAAESLLPEFSANRKLWIYMQLQKVCEGPDLPCPT